MTFNSRWAHWTPSKPTEDAKRGDTSDKSPTSLQGSVPSGTSGTPNRKSYMILDSANVDPATLTDPAEVGRQPAKEFQDAILAGKVVLFWSRVTLTWTYMVLDSTEMNKVRARYRRAPVYTLPELIKIVDTRPPQNLIRAINSAKEILGAELTDIEDLVPQENEEP